MFSCQLCKALCQAFGCFLNLSEEGKTEKNLEAAGGKHLGILKWVKPQDRVWVFGEGRLQVVPMKAALLPGGSCVLGDAVSKVRSQIKFRRGCPSCSPVVSRWDFFVCEIGSSSSCQAVWERGGCFSLGIILASLVASPLPRCVSTSMTSMKT